MKLSLDPVPASLAAAREAVDCLLAEARPSDEFRCSVRIVVSELMSNAILHGSPSHRIDLNLTLEGDDVDVRIENVVLVRELETVPAGGRAEGGRGLQIVARLTEVWSIGGGPTATTATARIAATPL